MNQLKIEHIAPYLPYGLNGMFRVGDALPHLVSVADEVREKTLSQSNIEFFMLHCKPILRPLSDLTKEIEHNGERFVPMVKIADDFYKPRKHTMFGDIAECRNGQLWFEKPSRRFLYSGGDNTECPLRIFEMYQILFELHFDVFGLIEQGLAIDYNTLTK